MPSTYYPTATDIADINRRDYRNFHAHLLKGRQDAQGRFIEAFDTVNLNGKALDAATVENVAKALHGTSIKHVVLSANNFGLKTIDRATYQKKVSQGEAISADTVIQDEYRDLLLKGDLPPDGAELFLRSMPPTIESVDFSNNNIAPVSALRIGMAAQFTRLNMLFLQDNHISQGVVAFLKALQGTSLKVLNLSNNQIKDDAAKEMIPVLAMTNLDTIIAYNNDIHAKTLLDIQDILHKKNLMPSNPNGTQQNLEQHEFRTSMYEQVIGLKAKLYELQGFSEAEIQSRMPDFRHQCKKMETGALNTLLLSLQIKYNRIIKKEEHSDERDNLIEIALEKRRILLECKRFPIDKITNALQNYRQYCYSHSADELKEMARNDYKRIVEQYPDANAGTEPFTRQVETPKPVPPTLPSQDKPEVTTDAKETDLPLQMDNAPHHEKGHSPVI